MPPLQKVSPICSTEPISGSQPAFVLPLSRPLLLLLVRILLIIVFVAAPCAIAQDDAAALAAAAVEDDRFIEGVEVGFSLTILLAALILAGGGVAMAQIMKPK